MVVEVDGDLWRSRVLLAAWVAMALDWVDCVFTQLSPENHHRHQNCRFCGQADLMLDFFLVVVESEHLMFTLMSVSLPPALHHCEDIP